MADRIAVCHHILLKEGSPCAANTVVTLSMSRWYWGFIVKRRKHCLLFPKTKCLHEFSLNISPCKWVVMYETWYYLSLVDIRHLHIPIKISGFYNVGKENSWSHFKSFSDFNVTSNIDTYSEKGINVFNKKNKKIQHWGTLILIVCHNTWINFRFESCYNIYISKNSAHLTFSQDISFPQPSSCDSSDFFVRFSSGLWLDHSKLSFLFKWLHSFVGWEYIWTYSSAVK